MKPRAVELFGGEGICALGVPVAYTRHLGEQVIQHLERGRDLVPVDTAAYPAQGGGAA